LDLDENQPVEIFYPRAKDKDKGKDKKDYMADFLDVVTHEELLEIAQKTLEQFFKKNNVKKNQIHLRRYKTKRLSR